MDPRPNVDFNLSESPRIV